MPRAKDNKVDDDLSLSDLTADELSIVNGLRDLVAEEEKPKADAKKDTKEEFPQDELLYIYDNLLTQGRHMETVSIGKRVKVTWRTRTTGEANAVHRIIDSAGFSTFIAAQNHTNVLNMAYSLVNYCGKDMNEAKTADKKAFLEGLPEPVIVMLSKTLADFDYKVAKAIEVGQANF